jgi:hypothetical protein
MPNPNDRVTHRRRLLKPKRSLGTIAFRCATLLFMSLVVAHWGFSRYANVKLQQDLARFRAAGIPIDPADFAAPPVLDADNAAPDLIAAGQFLRQPSDVMDRFSQVTLFEPALPLNADEAEAISAAVLCGREALEQVDRAMRKPAVSWPRVGGDLMGLRDFTWLNVIRDVTNLCEWAALMAHQRGDEAGALRHVRRILFVAEAVERDASLHAQLSASFMHAQAARAIFEIAPTLRVSGAGRASRDVVRELIARFSSTQASHEAFVRGLESDRTQTWEFVKAFADGRGDLWGIHGDSQWERRFRCVLVRPLALNDVRLMLATDTRRIEGIRRSNTWPAFRDTCPDFEFPVEAHEHPYFHATVWIFGSHHGRDLEGHYWSTAARRIAAATLAVRLFAIDHDGQLPARLEDLVPAYLPAVPTDPMAVSDRPMGYHADAANPILYSVGDDGIDQAGSARPIRESAADLIDGDFDRLTEDAVVHLILPPRIRHH